MPAPRPRRALLCSSCKNCCGRTPRNTCIEVGHLRPATPKRKTSSSTSRQAIDIVMLLAPGVPRHRSHVQLRPIRVQLLDKQHTKPCFNSLQASPQATRVPFRFVHRSNAADRSLRTHSTYSHTHLNTRSRIAITIGSPAGRAPRCVAAPLVFRRATAVSTAAGSRAHQVP